MAKYFSAETEYFLYVLRCALNGITPEKPTEPIDWEKLINFSKIQEAYSILAAALPKEYLPEEQARRLHNYSKSELVRLLAMKNELAVLEERLGEEGIPFMLLKGARIRAFYPKESMRQMSDIDILYDETKRDSLLKIMKDEGYTLFSWSENSDDFSKKPYYTFEFHRQLFFDDFGQLANFSFVWESAKQDSKNASKYIMSDEDIYLHSIAHMYKHKVLGGFGVRFLADTYLILKNAEALDFDYISEKLDYLQLTDFEAFVRELSLCVIEDRELNEEQLDFMQNVVSFGVFGDKRQGKVLLYEQFKEKNGGSKSMVRYTLQRLFPSREYMLRTYRVLEKKPYLLPYYYIERLVTKTFTDGSKAANELKQIKEIQKKDK